MLLLPSTTRPRMVSRRQAAWGESMRDAGAAVEVEAGVLGMRSNLTEGAEQVRARCCYPVQGAAVLGVH